jgi:ABC-type lipoprotein release transport system permease subunit
VVDTVWLVARGRLRARRAAVVCVLVLVGLVGGLVLATAAGARRTSSSLERFRRWSEAADLELTVGTPTPEQLRTFERVRGVAEVAPLSSFDITLDRIGFIPLAAAMDDRFGREVDRARVVAGRLADPASPDELNIGEGLAQLLHLHAGDRLGARAYSAAQIEAAGTNGDPGAPDGPRLSFRVVGIVRRPLDLGDRGAAGGVVVLTPAFHRKYRDVVGSFSGTILRVRALDAADVPRLTSEARRIFGADPRFGSAPLAIESKGAADTSSVLADALWVFAAVVAAAGIVALAIMVGREVSLWSRENATLVAMGLTRAQLIRSDGPFALLVGLGGALLAVALAVAASPVFPIGVARRADPDVGVHVDGVVLGLGVVAIIVVVGITVLVAAVRATRRAAVDVESGSMRVSRVGAVATDAGLPPSATVGIRAAFEAGRGGRAIPLRSAVFGAVGSIAGIVAVAVFAAGVGTLASTPSRYGWDWTIGAADQTNGPRCGGGADDAAVARVRGASAVSGLCTEQISVENHPSDGWSFTPLRGTIDPTVIAGRAPRRNDEVMLGAATFSALGKHIGDRVVVNGPHGDVRYRIVGQTVFPRMSATSNFQQPMDDGLLFTPTGLARVFTEQGSFYRFELVRVAPGTAPSTVEHRVDAVRGLAGAGGPLVPVEIDRLRQIGWLPVWLAVVLGLLALVAVGHALVTTVRRRRHDLGILKTIGFERRQLRRSVLWQASTLTLVGLVVGVPVGLAVGVVVWQRVAQSLGIATTPTVPTLAILVLVPVALLVVNVIAYFPAHAAARTRAAVALRAE